MHHFLDNNSKRPASRNSSNRSQVLSILACIIIAAYLVFFVLPGMSIDDQHIPGSSGKPTTANKQPLVTEKVVRRPPPVIETEAVIHEATPKKATTSTMELRELPPWGYNRDRNVPRWRAIYKSIAADQVDTEQQAFTLVDYGADQGYFSISMAKFFPNALVMGLEMGGVGGEIWNKKGDVLSIQEGKLKANNVQNMVICQTRVEPKHFFDLKGQELVSDYQFVLSVFHWFKLPTREDFEKTVTTLFRNARTTFIELPTIGDSSTMIRKQVGWKYFSKWYDGRTDIQEILEEAAKAQQLEAKVTKVIGVKWLEWERVVYRVDVLPRAQENAGREKFGCAKRQEIYRCNMTRVMHNECP